MGATAFETIAKGRTAAEAFKAAVKDAKYEYGHGGYSGTIAEKNTFVEIPLPPGVTARHHAWKLIENDDPRIHDKWGPAGCIQLGKGEFLFFGWASE
jgi:hypothetical protein